MDYNYVLYQAATQDSIDAWWKLTIIKSSIECTTKKKKKNIYIYIYIVDAAIRGL